ncbi:MAG: SIS domain-containing protein [Chlorobi bacterium]|nr:MAG: phosphoheptose isomerase [Chlorobi bacterium OLB7]MBK8909993.1 SIS domain-containing protein [Chlorobiota bacterium]MCE7933067.1 SIS domain-containing protein [Chlorobi bacterium CHB2]
MNFSDYLAYTQRALESVDQAQINQFVETIFDAYQRRAMVFVIGNGGSAANASHLAQDLAKGTCPDLASDRRIRAISLTDNVAFISALGNDEGYEQIFVQQLRTFCHPGDVLIAISGSGNSPNILRAIEYANQNGITTIGVTGFGGGKLMEMVHQRVHVPLNDMCTAESIHSVIFHYVILQLQERIKESVS